MISGAYKMDFSEAERYKRDEANHAELLPVLKPVIEKVAPSSAAMWPDGTWTESIW